MLEFDSFLLSNQKYVKQDIVRFVEERGIYVDYLRERCLSISKERIVWRSAWVLAELIKRNHDVISDKEEFVVEIIEKLSFFETPGQVRELLKVLLIYFSYIPESKYAVLINVCFVFLQDKYTDVSFKVHGMQLLYNISEKYPEIKRELRMVLEDIVKYEKKGVQSRALKILRKLF